MLYSNLDEVGRIFDIQRYSIHDGPGIRTIVFVKGCIFRCRWCCNPESQSRKIEEWTINGKKRIIGYDVTVAQVMQEVEKDRPYYNRSGGGLTISGGEVLLQDKFAACLLKAAKDVGINTAIESMAGLPFERIENILPYLDYYLMDIKHINSAKHKEFIGVGNEVVLQNALNVTKCHKTNLIIRVPVIPTFNCTHKEIMEIAKFADNLPNVTKIHLLPYHRLGTDKYDRLNRRYEMSQIRPPSDELMQEFKAMVEKNTNLTCMIGG